MRVLGPIGRRHRCTSLRSSPAMQHNQHAMIPHYTWCSLKVFSSMESRVGEYQPRRRHGCIQVSTAPPELYLSSAAFGLTNDCSCRETATTLLEAKIVFAVDEAHSSDATAAAPMILQITAESRGKSHRPSSAFLISERPRTSISLTWSPAVVDGEVTTLETPDLSEVITEVPYQSLLTMLPPILLRVVLSSLQ